MNAGHSGNVLVIVANSLYYCLPMYSCVRACVYCVQYIAFVKGDVEGCFSMDGKETLCGRELAIQMVVIFLSNDFLTRFISSVRRPPLSGAGLAARVQQEQEKEQEQE